jgi:hypothetical protein
MRQSWNEGWQKVSERISLRRGSEGPKARLQSRYPNSCRPPNESAFSIVKGVPSVIWLGIGLSVKIVRARRLTGRGYLSGDGCYFQVYYFLICRSQDSRTPRPDDSAVGRIAGTVEPPPGVFLPAGRTMVLTLQDGHKLNVMTDAREKITGISGFYR